MTTGLQLRSRISKAGDLELSLTEATFAEPGPDQVLVKVEASPINPSDLGLLLGPADMSTAKASGSGAGIKIAAKVPNQALPFIAARLDQAMPVGIQFLYQRGRMAYAQIQDSSKILGHRIKYPFRAHKSVMEFHMIVIEV